MKNATVSTTMGSWQATTASSATGRLQDPHDRYATARAVVARLRAHVQALLDRARAAGFDLSEALAIPAVRQALLAALLPLRLV